MNTALERAQTALLARRSGRQTTGSGSVTDARHQPLQLAQRPIGSGNKSDVQLYLLISYCPGCLRGHVVDLVREVPDGTPDARELEVRQLRPWRLECAETANLRLEDTP